jgi:hypothetical protein
MPLILSRTTSGAVDGSSSSARIASPPAASSPLPDAYDAAEKVVPCALTPLLCRCRLRLRRCRCPCFSLLLFVTPNQWEKTLLSPSPPFPFPSSSSSSSFHLEMADGAFKDPRRILLLLDCAVKKDDDVDDERAAKRFLLSIFLMCVVILSLFFVKEVRDEKATSKAVKKQTVKGGLIYIFTYKVLCYTLFCYCFMFNRLNSRGAFPSRIHRVYLRVFHDARVAIFNNLSIET